MPSYLQVLPQPGGDETDDGASAQRRGALKGLRGISATLGGFEPGEAGPGMGDGRPIVPYRPLSPGHVRVDLGTGDVQVEHTRDPLAGEVFDSPEFENSQEKVNQGG